MSFSMSSSCAFSRTKISLIAIHHNAPDKMERLVRSIGQVPENVEIIIIDDCSDKRERSKLSKFVDRYFSDMKVFVTFYCMGDWKGPGGARDMGARMADGDWLWFLDGDDELMPGALERLMKVLERTDAPIVVVDNETVHPDGRVEQVKIAENAYCLALWQVGVMAWQKVIRREWFVPFREKCFGEDMDWWPNQIMALPKGCEYDTVPGGPLYRYHYQGEGSVTASVEKILAGEVPSVGGLTAKVAEGYEEMMAALRLAVVESVKRQMPDAFTSHIEFMIRSIESKHKEVAS